MTTRPLIIDTDPGVDDFLAILLAFHNRMNIRGLTTVFGNVSLNQATMNARTIVEILNGSVGVYAGADKPLCKNPVRAECHGVNGLGDFKPPSPSSFVSYESADSFLERQLQENERLDIACLGPLTNIAKVIHRCPDLVRQRARIVALGGVFGESGNITQYAEFNAYNDPDAVDCVLKSGADVVLVPANVCRTVVLTRADVDAVPQATCYFALRDIVDAYIGYYERDATHGGFAGGVMYDVLVTAFLLDPSLFLLRPASVIIDVSDGERRGQTVEVDGQSNCLVVRQVEAYRIRTLLVQSMCTES